MKILMKALAASAMLCAAMPAAATAYVFNTTGSSPVNGAYGNALTYSATTGASTINARITGWQANSSNGVISSAYLAAFGSGLGVTGLGDQSGANNYHQVDNAGGYTDFLFFQFDQAVNLTSVYLNSFGLPNVGTDNDIQFTSPGVPSAAWNSAINLSTYNFGGPYTANNGSTASRLATLGSSDYATQWVIAAGAGSINDGFKLSRVTVNTSAVPEPGTWAMMLIGFGVVGASMRSRRKVMTLQAA